MQQKILITGGTGLLGKALIDTSNDNTKILSAFVGNYELADTDKLIYKKADVSDIESYDKIFKDFRPSIVIHTASIGSPDFAEKNKDFTWKINVEGTANIISLCEKYNSSFIYISSNGIFDGDKAPYKEDAIPAPINFYGMTKYEGEILTQKAKIKKAIIRPILLYGWSHPYERGNIVTMAIDKLSKNETMSAYDDVYSNSLYNIQCAEVIWKMIDKDLYGTYNISGGERTSIYGLLKETARVFGLDENLLKPVKQGFFNELVKRPVDTSYDTHKIETVLGISPYSLAEGLTLMKKERDD